MNDTPQTSAEAALKAALDYIQHTLYLTGSERQVIRDAIATNFAPIVRERDELWLKLDEVQSKTSLDE